MKQEIARGKMAPTGKRHTGGALPADRVRVGILTGLVLKGNGSFRETPCVV